MSTLIGVGDCEAVGLECPNGHSWLNPVPARPGEYECSYFGCGWRGELTEQEYVVHVEYSYREEGSTAVTVVAGGARDAERLARRKVHEEQSHHDDLTIESVVVEEIARA